ncbi:MAG TPA: acetoacetate decarboxylase family protein [Roseiarcus sp.]|nr:acetoacetate decarboxylase family protein [Roseiarcus sp.]
MGARGRLTLERLGYSMPSDAPAYQAPPYHYRGAQAISIKFETDPEAALEVLPEPLELIEPACANLSIHWYPFTTFGPYHEAILRLYARHEGKPLTYIQQIFVDTEPPMLAGREVWGYPKKLAKIGFEHDRDMIVGTLERPARMRLASVVMRPEQPVAQLGSNGPTTGLRIIPSADPATTRPALAELIAAESQHKLREAWEGPGSISFPDHSAFDPVDRFPVRRIVKAIYMDYDITLPAGRVIARL